MEEEILKLIERHDRYRRQGINLIASENVLSKEVAEVTHIGMGREEMEEITHMMADVYKGKNVKDKAIKMAQEFYEKFYE